MRTLSRRRIPPMPIEDLIDNPRIIALPPAGWAMIGRLCVHYWASECRPFPMNEDTLFGIMRAPRPTFRHYKAEVLSIFKKFGRGSSTPGAPELTVHEGLRRLRARRTANERAKAMVQGETQTPVPATPKHSWRGKAKLVERRFAAPASESAPAEKGFFRDF